MIVMVRYHVDSEKLSHLIAQRGYAHLTEFARAHGFNRATMHHYFKGQGPISESYYAICDALQVDPISLLLPVAEEKIDDLLEIMSVVKKLCASDDDIAVGLLGSRAMGRHRKYSDWDLGLTGGRRALSGLEFLRLKRTVDDEVDGLPREVDFVNLDAAPEWFLQGIDYEPVFIAGNMNAWTYFLGVLHGSKKRG